MSIANDEEKRILRAAREGRIHMSGSGRYVIDGERRPDRKTRERLMRRGWIRWSGWTSDAEMRITALGEAALAEPRS